MMYLPMTEVVRSDRSVIRHSVKDHIRMHRPPTLPISESGKREEGEGGGAHGGGEGQVRARDGQLRGGDWRGGSQQAHQRSSNPFLDLEHEGRMRCWTKSGSCNFLT
ncbi:hypothetical protein BO83DRAFT_125307 [Aspergillus eucalypticola CBS 122712]|uniref:Uncharacterized protein n=1 Tax=Aspergillus eucalypticola (strain CBS 122712 / IBT 29274) TaxID=1448314 RepID=A0A317UTM2_ASPEC|nr:uncharacterized protein BO83DRAFT_125307 [Aspergillus eucalypticola CBS 122712]PWY64811.1 hypothetical protein BO83DRAFT_125307 [Aspergillus eucalypticola CBS 122712]